MRGKRRKAEPKAMKEVRATLKEMVTNRPPMPRAPKKGDKVIEPFDIKNPVKGTITSVDGDSVVIQRECGEYFTTTAFYGITWRYVDDEAKPGHSDREGDQGETPQ